MITKEQFAEWKTHPVTKEIFTILKEVRKDMVDQMVAGSLLGATADETHGHTNRAYGQLSGIDQILTMEFDGVPIIDDIDERTGY